MFQFRSNPLILLSVFLIILLVTSCSQKKYADNEKKSKKISTAEVHSFSRPDLVRVGHMDLDLEILWSEQILQGSVTYTLIRQKDHDTLVLDTRQLRIDSVKGNGKHLFYQSGKAHPVFGSALHIHTGNLNKVTVYYRTAPESEALQWLKAEQTHDRTDPFLYSQSQAILARTWIPCQDAPSVKFTYKAKVKTKPGYLVLMSASNPQKTEPSGVYVHEMDQPISSYLLAISSGKLAFKPVGTICGIYAEPGMLEKAVWEFADMEKMIGEAGKLYGAYMWKRYDVLVLPPSFPFGGMENPRLTFATPTVITGDRSQVALIAHELAHSWSGNLVTNTSWNDFWLNEGFTTYFEQRIMEQLYGSTYDQMRQLLAWNDLGKTIAAMKADNLMQDTKLKLDLKGRNPDDGLTDVAYEKGRFFLCHLEKVVGKANWDGFLKKYFAQFAFKSMDTETFIEFLNTELLNQNPSWKSGAMVDEWVYGEGMPGSALKPESSELSKVDRMLQGYFSGKTKAEQLDTLGFTSHHWQYLIRNFGLKANLQQVKEFDRVFRFSYRSNAEICCDWFVISAKTGYTQNRDKMKQFLTGVGRRKFLLPIYQELAQTREGKKWAQEVFQQARKGYHAVSATSVEEIIYP